MSLGLRGLYPRLLALPRALRVAALAGMAAVIVWESQRPGSASAGDSALRSFAMNWGHQLLYGLLAVTGALAVGLRLPAPRAVAGLCLAVAAAGLLDEANQAGQPFRDSSLWDLVSDTLGAAFALLIAGRTARREGPVLPPALLLALVAASAAWNCVPTFAPNLPLTTLSP